MLPDCTRYPFFASGSGMGDTTRVGGDLNFDHARCFKNMVGVIKILAHRKWRYLLLKSIGLSF